MMWRPTPWYSSENSPTKSPLVGWRLSPVLSLGVVSHCSCAPNWIPRSLFNHGAARSCGCVAKCDTATSSATGAHTPSPTRAHMELRNCDRTAEAKGEFETTTSAITIGANGVILVHLPHSFAQSVDETARHVGLSIFLRPDCVR